MKKRKEKILRNKEQSTEQSTKQSSVQSSVESTGQPSVQSTVQPNDTYVYGASMLVVLAIGVCVFFVYNTFQPKKLKKKKKDQPPKGRHMLQKHIQ